MLNYSLTGYHGIILNDYDIGLDVSQPVCQHLFVSHAHADHLPRDRNMHVYATPPTAALMRLRGFNGGITELPFLQSVDLGKARVTLYPAGHILGSAMIFIETDTGNTLYTGDYKNPPSPVSEGFQLPQYVDYFITEATFPLPIYKWKPFDEMATIIQKFALSAINDDSIPVFLCYNLGKAQEVMHALAPLNRTTQIHGAGYKLCKVHEDFGFNIGTYESYKRETLTSGKILITPSSSLEQPMLKNLKRKKIAYVSGWATHESRRAQMPIDARIALSDHIDFFELLNLCKLLNPKMVYITHTPNPAVVKHYLDEIGINSQPLHLEAVDED